MDEFFKILFYTETLLDNNQTIMSSDRYRFIQQISFYIPESLIRSQINFFEYEKRAFCSLFKEINA